VLVTEPSEFHGLVQAERIFVVKKKIQHNVLDSLEVVELSGYVVSQGFQF
jgi:hypothetical protein